MAECPHRPKVLMVDDAHENVQSPDLETRCLELEAELSKAKCVEEELRNQITVFELRLAKHTAGLTAAHDELRQELQRRIEDLNEIYRLNENLGRHNEDLLQQKKDFETVSRELESFSYSISHDLRAPLRHLVGFSGALMEDYGDKLDATALSFLDCMAKAARKMDLQIEALLNLSRVTRHELSIASVDLSHLVRECAASLQDSEPERRAVFTIADQLSVRADVTLLRAVIGHLLGNAWKYTGKKEAASIEFGRQQDGDCAVFFVRDNGAGFDMRYADRLFGAFQRMHKDNEFEGMGVGLATVQRIIHRHGGRIWAEATLDAGATFFFTLSESRSSCTSGNLIGADLPLLPPLQGSPPPIPLLTSPLKGEELERRKIRASRVR